MHLRILSIFTQVRRDLVDVGIYCCSHWIIEFLQANPKISSIRADLAPYLIRRQFLTAEAIIADIPSIEFRRRPLKHIEPFLVSSCSGKDTVKQFSDSVSPNAINTTPICAGGLGRRNSYEEKSIFDFAGSKDILRCFALISDGDLSSTMAAEYIVGGSYCQKVSSTQVYMNLNRYIFIYVHCISPVS